MNARRVTSELVRRFLTVDMARWRYLVRTYMIFREVSASKF